MRVDESLFTPDFQMTPYWWEAAPRPRLAPAPLPDQVDVAVVGSGFTGLSAALTLARAGRSVAVIEAKDPGEGASSRNAGFVGKTLKHGFRALVESRGPERAKAVWLEAQHAFDYVTGLIEREQIACHLERCGRFMAALSARHYEAMARDLELKRKHLGQDYDMVPRSHQQGELGSELYHGGAVVPDLGSVHPGLYQLGLLERVASAGAQVIANTPVTAIGRDSSGFAVRTSRGLVRARDVVVATNGYTGAALPWFRRRVIPFRAFMIATEPLAPEALDRIFPKRRTYHDYNHNLVYMRPAPDSERLLMGGLTGTAEDDVRAVATRLKGKLCGIFPELKEVCLSHAWMGYGGGTFDLYPHVGMREGVHYAMGYCFAGLPMGTYLGHKVALKLLGRAEEGATAFDELRFETRFFYRGRPWFVPLFARYSDWLDRRAR